MKTIFRSLILLIVAQIGLSPAPALARPAEAPAGPVTSIAEARNLAPGTMVTLDGVVSTPSGAFESSFSDKGFGLQDGSAGIYVGTQFKVNGAAGKHARVTGTLKNQSGLLVVVPAAPADVRLHGNGPAIAPLPVQTGAVGEATQGRIVRIQGKITQAPQSDAPYGFKFTVNDGSGDIVIFINTQTRIAMRGLTMGKELRITGFSSQYDTHFEIDPRSPADISAAKS
jgi:uncharacterized protein YdeI (BOF family)